MRHYFCSFSQNLGDLTQERIGRGEPQGDTGTDNESCVDQAHKQEHLGLQFTHELGLARSSFEELATHDANTNTSTQGAQTDDHTCSDIPTIAPSDIPTMTPSISPSILPSSYPTYDPTLNPSMSPSVSPSQPPTESPTFDPTNSPTVVPTKCPSIIPSVTPSMNPSIVPTDSLFYRQVLPVYINRCIPVSSQWKVQVLILQSSLALSQLIYHQCIPVFPQPWSRQ